MADRQVKVQLFAEVNGYVAGMDRAARATREMANDSAARLAQQRQAFESMGRAALAVGVLAVAGVAIAVRKYAEFDQAMSNVSAVTQETTSNMQALRAAALEAGGETIYTATEAANAVEELGKAGLSTADILSGALDQSLALAASGQLEVARAAEITATTLKQYGLSGDQAQRVADTLSAAAGKALGSVEDLAQAMKFVGPVAASMGISLEETAGALALFADQGLLGEQAGTSLRGVLSSLTSPSSAAAKEIANLGISLYDANGAFLGLDNVADQLAGAYRNLDDQTRDASLGIIFGNQQVTAARVLFQKGGEAIREYTHDVTESGYAARVAADRLDNLRGDLEKLGGAFDTLLINQGSAANNELRGLVQGLTFLVEASADLPPVAVNIGVVTAAIGLAGGVALLSVGKIAAFRTTLAAAGLTARTAAVAIGTVTAALTVVTLVISTFIDRSAQAAANADAFKESLSATSGALTQYSRDLVIKRLEETGAFDAAARLGISQRELTDAVIEGGAAYEEYSRQLSAPGFNINPFDNTKSALYDVRQEMDAGIEAWKNQQKANEEAAEATQENADALAVLEGKAFDASEQIDELSSIILNFGKAALDTREAERRFQAAIDDITESIEDNGRSLDVNTERGRENEAALDDLAEAALKRASAILVETGSQEKATEAIAAGRQALIDALAQFGITGQAAEDYADMLGLIPSNIEQVVTIQTSGAEETIRQFITTFEGKTIRFNLAADQVVVNGRVYGGLREGYASGGYTGNLPTTAVAGVVHGREFVTNAAATSIPANRAALEYMNAGGNIAGWNGGYQPTSVTNNRPIQVEMQVVSDDPYATGELVMQKLAAKLATLG